MKPGLFDRAFYYLMKDEGGLSNDPDDPGGLTKFGITRKAYSRFADKEVSPYELKNLSIKEAKYFYQKVYWIPLRCDSLEDSAIAIALFDSGVLYGTGTVVQLAQAVIVGEGRELEIDGRMGPKTVDELNLSRRIPFLYAFQRLLLNRIDTLCDVNPRLRKFRTGWVKRADRLLGLVSEP